MIRRVCALAFAAAFSFGLALVKTWPLARHLASRIPSDPGDPFLNTWILAWCAHALTTWPLTLFDGNIFYPATRSLALSEHMLGVQPMFAPAYLVTGNPVIGYNIVFFLSFWLSALGGFWLAYHWTRSYWPAMVAGITFGFALLRFEEISHIQLLNFFWAPLALVSLDRFLGKRRWRDCAVFAILFWLQVLSSVYLGYLLTVAVLLYVGHRSLEDGRSLWTVPMTTKAAVFLIASLVVLVPVHYPYLELHRRWGLVRSLDELRAQSPDLLNYLAPPPLVNDTYRRVLERFFAFGGGERRLFPGLVVPSLVLLGSVGSIEGLASDRVRSVRRVCWLILLAAFALSLGPSLKVAGHDTGVPLPYVLPFRLVPGFDSMRVPGRFALLANLAACPLVAFGTCRCINLIRRKVNDRRALPIASAVVAMGLMWLFLMESGWKPLPTVRAPWGEEVPGVYRWLAQARPGPIVEIPFGQDMNPAWAKENLGLLTDHRYVYFSMVHWLPLVNGSSGFSPPTYEQIRGMLADLPAPAALESAGALGIRAVILHCDKALPEIVERWQAEEAAGRIEKLASFGMDVAYSVPLVARAGSLKATLSVPGRVPAGLRIRPGLELRPGADGPWVDSDPYSRSWLAVKWTDGRGQHSYSELKRVRLPFLIGPQESVTLPLELTVPSSSGRYMLKVSHSGAGFVALAGPVEVERGGIASSTDGPPHLRADYVHGVGAVSVEVRALGTLPIDITVFNTGDAVWLAQAPGDKGVVALGWRWFGGTTEVRDLSDSQRIIHDVFPGQQYRFRATLRVPARPGRYVLELGLLSEKVTWFSDAGSAPVKFQVTVAPGIQDKVDVMLAKFRKAVAFPPRVVLSATRTAHTYHVVGRIASKNREAVDAYLIGEREGDGSMWFHDGRGLVPWSRGWWPSVALDMALPGRDAGSPALVDVEVAGLLPGRYTWYLALTEPQSYRVIAEAQTELEVASDGR